MRSSARERVTRLLIGSLLSSDLSANELRRIADMIFDDPLFVRDFAASLKNVAREFEEFGQKSVQPAPYRNDLDWEDVYSLIQSKAIPKREVLDQMMKLSASWRRAKYRIDLPVKELVRQFFEVATDTDSRRLLMALKRQEKEGSDPYLSGIVRKSLV
jgi:hypothetical protein